MTLKNMLDIVTEYSGFKHHCLYNTDKAIEFIRDIKDNPDSKSLINLDYDPDGILSGVQVFDLFNELDLGDVNVYIPDSKRHGIDEDTVNELRCGYTHLIVVDSSTNSMSLLKSIVDMGIKVLIIDHHLPEYSFEDYPSGVTLVNNKMHESDNCVRELSAGFVTYLLTTSIREYYGYPRNKSHFIYGYITLISDSCELSTDYIKPIILDISKYSTHIPRPVKLFMGDYDELNRQFTSFRFVNRVNTLCRSDRPDLIRKLFFELSTLDCVAANNLKNEIVDIHSTVADKVVSFTEHLANFVEEIGSFIVVDMSKAVAKTSLSNEYLINSTGQFANNLSRRFNKPCVCIMPSSRHMYKCSARDCTGSIDLFEMGQRFNLGGGGHKGAYGFELEKYDLNEFKMLIGTVDLRCGEEICIDCNSLSYVEFRHMVHQVAMYNEVSGDKLPKLNLRRTLNSAFIVNNIGSLRLFSMRDIEVKDFSSKLNLGDTVEMTPVYAGKPYCVVR